MSKKKDNKYYIKLVERTPNYAYFYLYVNGKKTSTTMQFMENKVFDHFVDDIAPVIRIHILTTDEVNYHRLKPVACN